MVDFTHTLYCNSSKKIGLLGNFLVDLGIGYSIGITEIGNCMKTILAVTHDFLQCSILTSGDSFEPV